VNAAEEEGLRNEVERAAASYYHSTLQTGIDNRTRAFVIERCVGQVRPGAALELGYIDGLWSVALPTRVRSLDIVEGATRHVEHARKRFSDDPRVRVYHNLFQTFAPDRRYDTVVAGDMLHYLADPVTFLRRVHPWLQTRGVLIVTVPNSRSLHRRIGTWLGMEDSPVAANLRDREMGNRHAFDRDSLGETLRAAGWQPRAIQGVFLKPLSSAQMERWSDGLLRAFLRAGDELEDYAWFLVAVCSSSA